VRYTRLGALAALGDVSAPARHLPATPTLSTLQGIPDGPEGTVATLRIMRSFARAALRSSNQAVRLLALQIVSNIPDRSYMGEARALQEWVRDQIRYVMDPDDLELVQTPEKTLEFGQGDCDDKSTLLASFLSACGHPCRFVAVGFNEDAFSHVLVETKIGERWVSCETIVPVSLGWYPTGVTSRYVLSV